MDDAGPGPRVLLAEDDPVSARFLREALERLGARVSLATDGPSALALACATRFDLLLLDLGLPGLGGAEVLARLRGMPAAASRESRALATSAARRPGPEIATLGFGGLLAKPLRIADLESALGGCVREPRDVRPPVLDDAAALAALGGIDAVHDLRRLLAIELPAQRDALRAALAAATPADARAVLHRLHASTRFCGAASLAEASSRLAAALETPGDAVFALRELEAAVDAYLAAVNR